MNTTKNATEKTPRRKQNFNTTKKDNKKGRLPLAPERQKSQKPPTQKGSSLRIIPLGGLDGIGMNMMVLEYGQDMIIIDAGLMFPDDDHPGVDLILPDYTYVLENSHKLRGILITHGHEDHTGALPYLLKDLDIKVPVYSTRLTMGFIEGKFKELRVSNAKLHQILAEEKKVKLGAFDCEFFKVNHSIPGSVGIYIKTPVGTILHTGDFKFDQTPVSGGKTDFGAILKFASRGIDVLLSDSTNAQNPNFTHSESEVGVALREIIKKAEKRVIVASFASHIDRIQQVCDAAIKAGRKVAVTGRSMLTNSEIAKELGYLKIPDDKIIDSYNVKDIPRKKLVVLCTGSQGEPLSALVRIANGEHRTIDIEEGDTVIISASPVPGNEKAVTRVKNVLAKVGIDVYDKSRATVHVSGHAGAEELKLMLAMVNPKFFIPIHGETQHLKAHANLASKVGIKDSNILIAQNGDILELKDGKLRNTGTIETGLIYVDGVSVGDISHVVLKDRKTLASEGILTAVCMINKRDGRPVGEVEIIMRGVSGEDVNILQTESAQAVQATLLKMSRDYKENPGSLKKAIRETLIKLMWDQFKRRPMIIPIIMEV